MLDPRLPFAGANTEDPLDEMGAFRRRILNTFKDVVAVKTINVDGTTDPCTANPDNPVNNSTDATFFLADATGGTYCLNLPDARLYPHLVYFFKKVDASANGVMLCPFGSQTIDGSPDRTLVAPNEAVGIASDGDNWQVLFEGPPLPPALPQQTSSIGVTFDGGGEVIEQGKTADIWVPFNCTIQAVTVLAHEVGDIGIDIWKVGYADFPPTAANAITGSTRPQLSSTNKYQDVSLSGWTTTIDAGDTIRFSVHNIATITQATLVLKVVKT